MPNYRHEQSCRDTPAAARNLRAAAAPGMCAELRRLVLDDGVDVACASREEHRAARRSESATASRPRCSSAS